jgi:hypothetical protein
MSLGLNLNQYMLQLLLLEFVIYIFPQHMVFCAASPQVHNCVDIPSLIQDVPEFVSTSAKLSAAEGPSIELFVAFFAYCFRDY